MHVKRKAFENTVDLDGKRNERRVRRMQNHGLAGGFLYREISGRSAADFLLRLVALVKFLRLSLKKAAYVDLVSFGK